MMFDVFSSLPDTLIALGTLMGAFGALILTLRNGHTQSKAKLAAEVAAQKAEETKAELAVIDGQIRQLGQRAAHAIGKAEGKAESRMEGKADERDEAAPPATGAVVDVKIVATKGTVPVTVKKTEVSDSGFKK